MVSVTPRGPPDAPNEKLLRWMLGTCAYWGSEGEIPRVVGSFLKTQRRRRDIVAAGWFMDEVAEPRKATRNSFTDAVPSVFESPNYHLGTAGEVAAKARKEEIRHAWRYWSKK